jgi:hypothetical protein
VALINTRDGETSEEDMKTLFENMIKDDLVTLETSITSKIDTLQEKVDRVQK